MRGHSEREQCDDGKLSRTGRASRPRVTVGTRGGRPRTAHGNDPPIPGRRARSARGDARCPATRRYGRAGAIRAFPQRSGEQSIGEGYGRRRPTARKRRKKQGHGIREAKSRAGRTGRETTAPGARRTLPGSYEMRILIADDESVSRRMLQALLGKWGYDVDSAEDGDAAWEKLKAPDAPRMALLDWMMPGQNGVDVCRALRKLRPEPYTYILLLTAKDAKESVVEGLESGADDYLTKPFNPQELKARIRVGLRLLELEDNLVQAREAMRFKATHDTLTGVWNRGAILETLEREVIRSRREGT